MLIPEQIQLASMAVREVRVALSNFFLYSSENAMVKQSLDRLLQVLANLFENLPSISLGESEGRLVVEGAPLDERLTGSTNMIKDLFITQKIHTLTFLKGVESAELETLFSLLKPRALPQGVSLAQALVQHSLSHVKVNEKVFVALSEGEVVMSADSAGPGNEQNLQEALEALQYFLQIFSRVRPDSNKQEVAKRLMDNMGFWLSSEGVLPSSSEGAGGSGETGGVKTGSPNVQPWKELMGGFLGLRNALTAMKTPAEITQTQVSMEDLLKKLVLLGESQGVSLTEEPGKKMPPTDSPGPAGPTAHAEVEKPGLAPPEQENLFETDPVLAAINTGDWNTLLKPDLEDQFAQKLPYLQEPERADAFEPLWETLWGKIFSPDEEAQTLALRQVSRMQWSSLPRTLQLEGLRNLRMMLLRTRTPALFMMTLAMAQDWITQELVSPDWTEILETTRLLEELSELSPPNFEGQNNAARVALETIYTGPVLENLHMLYVAGGKEAPALLKLFKELGHRTTSFLLQKIVETEAHSPPWVKTVEILESLQTAGLQVYETILDSPEMRDMVEKFLEIFLTVAPPPELDVYFEHHWNTFSQAAQAKILSIVAKWKKMSFRPLLESLLQKPESPIALPALETFAQVGMEGDGEIIISAFHRYPLHGKERETFWIKSCQALGALQDAPSASALMEWAGKYKFMELKKGRSLEVRCAALEALAKFHSTTVRSFLMSLQDEGEKEVKTEVERALKTVEENLASRETDSPPEGV